MTRDKNCRAGRGDPSYLFDGDAHREKVATETTILLLVGDSGQTNSRNSTQKVYRYLVIPINLKRYWANLLLSKIPYEMTESVVIMCLLPIRISRPRNNA